MAFWCKGKKDYCNDTSCEACNKCKFENGSGGIELEDDDTDGIIIRQWISVKDRLPDDLRLVLVYVRHPAVSMFSAWSCIMTDMWLGAKWAENADSEAHEVTHWMPLPEPPKEE